MFNPKIPLLDPYCPIFGDPVGPWIRCFAWLPRFTVDAGKVWLRFVWKRHCHKKLFLDGGADWWFQYKRYEDKAVTDHV